MAEILLLSGPPASDKTTLARLLSERYDRIAHIDVAHVRSLRTAGRFHRWSSDPEGLHQKRQAVKQSAHLARDFLDEGVGVIIEDAIAAALRSFNFIIKGLFRA
jgi:adenylate kinase family enzyme